jgi:hypothetical protein
MVALFRASNCDEKDRRVIGDVWLSEDAKEAMQPASTPLAPALSARDANHSLIHTFIQSLKSGRQKYGNEAENLPRRVVARLTSGFGTQRS